MKSLFSITNIRRIVYLLGGLAFIFIAIKDQVWWIGIFGLYFLAMSIFKFGCAAGNCGVDFEQHNGEKQSH